MEENWFLKDMQCYHRLKNDSTYKDRLRQSYVNYMKKGFQDLLSYVPSKDIEEMTFTELNAYHNLIKNVPTCDILINGFYENKYNHITNQSSSNYGIMGSSTNFFDTNEYVRKIGDQLNKIETRIDELNQRQNLSINNHHNYGYQSNLQQEQDLRNKLQQTQQLHTTKPNTNSTYGWNYIPPQYWRVPQQRPPVCTPSSNCPPNKVMPILDKGAPVDALEWTQVGSILPKFQYNEVQ